ncbi:MAG: ABC transporter substrate-binding protein [Alphaproteobacteria bacterium]|nr:ABC transporter substrate-binding protein [Alphaproteobacteria bacterium]
MISVGRPLSVLTALVMVAATIGLTIQTAQAREQPSKFMQRAANELIAASRSGSAGAFARVINKYADKPTIGLYSLGNYAKSLASRDRGNYFTGMVGFLARYAASQAPKYNVRSAMMVSQTKETRTGVYVDSVVTMTDGSSYDVRWWLIRRGGTYRVGDVSVLGFWGREQLKRLFEGYISDNGGNPKALILALNK